MRVAILTGLLTLFSMASAAAQPLRALDGMADGPQQILRPRIAVGPDGAFAVAWEAYQGTAFSTRPEWQIGVQRFAPSGTPVGEASFFRGESCSSLDMWLHDIMENVELAFRADGILQVLMQHRGEYQFAGDGVRSSEATLGAIDTSGRVIDLNSSGNCVQRKLIFVGANRQDRPRMAMTPRAETLIILDGFFEGSNFRNVAIRTLNGDLGEVVSQAIPHEDPRSESSYHMYPDIATNGSVALSVWMECPMIDTRGNAAECDIAGQYINVAAGGTLSARGGNFKVTTGDPPGTVSVWPAVAMASSGSAVVVWADTRLTPNGDVFGQRFDGAGQPVGSNFRISTGEGEIYTRPEVALREDGTFMVVWTDSVAAGFRAMGRVYGASAEPTGPPVQLLGTGGAITFHPSVAVAGASFTYALAGLQGTSPFVYTSALGRVVAAEPEAPEVSYRELGLRAYPNPVSAEAVIEYTLEGSGPVSLSLYDLLGREVWRAAAPPHEVGRNVVRFDEGGLSPGVYLLRLRQGAEVRDYRLVLVR